MRLETRALVPGRQCGTCEPHMKGEKEIRFYKSKKFKNRILQMNSLILFSFLSSSTPSVFYLPSPFLLSLSPLLSVSHTNPHPKTQWTPSANCVNNKKKRKNMDIWLKLHPDKNLEIKEHAKRWNIRQI